MNKVTKKATKLTLVATAVCVVLIVGLQPAGPKNVPPTTDVLGPDVTASRLVFALVSLVVLLAVLLIAGAVQWVRARNARTRRLLASAARAKRRPKRRAAKGSPAASTSGSKGKSEGRSKRGARKPSTTASTSRRKRRTGQGARSRTTSR